MFRSQKPQEDFEEMFKSEAQIVNEITAFVEAKVEARKAECDRREKALAEASFDILHLLDLLTDLGHPAVAARMKGRLTRSGVLKP